LFLIVDDYGGVVVKLNMRAVRSHYAFMRPDDNRFNDIAFLYVPVRRSGFNGSDYYIADIAASDEGTAQYPYAHDFFGAGVVGYL
jgi:hypothetical protein